MGSIAQRYMNRGVTFGVAAAAEALDNSGLVIDEDNADQVGVIFSSGGGGTDLLLQYQKVRAEKGPRRVTPFLVANVLPAGPSGHLALATRTLVPTHPLRRARS